MSNQFGDWLSPAQLTANTAGAIGSSCRKCSCSATVASLHVGREHARAEPSVNGHALGVHPIDEGPQVRGRVRRRALGGIAIAYDGEPSQRRVEQVPGHVAHAPARHDRRRLPVLERQAVEQVDQPGVGLDDRRHRVDRGRAARDLATSGHCRVTPADSEVRPSLTAELRPHGHLHQHFVILDAVDDDLAGQPPAFLEAEPAIERLGAGIGRANLNGQLAVAGPTRKCLGGAPQLAANDPVRARPATETSRAGRRVPSTTGATTTGRGSAEPTIPAEASTATWTASRSESDAR